MNIFKLFSNVKKFANTFNEHSPFINFLLTYSSFDFQKSFQQKWAAGSAVEPWRARSKLSQHVVSVSADFSGYINFWERISCALESSETAEIYALTIVVTLFIPKLADSNITRKFYHRTKYFNWFPKQILSLSYSLACRLKPPRAASSHFGRCLNSFRNGSFLSGHRPLFVIYAP